MRKVDGYNLVVNSNNTKFEKYRNYVISDLQCNNFLTPSSLRY